MVNLQIIRTVLIKNQKYRPKGGYVKTKGHAMESKKHTIFRKKISGKFNSIINGQQKKPRIGPYDTAPVMEYNLSFEMRKPHTPRD